MLWFMEYLKCLELREKKNNPKLNIMAEVLQPRPATQKEADAIQEATDI